MNMVRHICLWVWLAGCGWAFAPIAGAAEARVLPPGKRPNDARFEPLKTLDGYFPFTPPATKTDWEARAQQLHRQMRVALGLWPMPEATPPHAVVHTPVVRDGVSVSRVYLESFPGHYVTGSLFQPAGRDGPLPAILSPHGHGTDGRFHRFNDEELESQLKQGAERYERSGRSPKQARCVQLAKMGCIVFHYDMVGYADSQQLAHRLGSRARMNTMQDWGYFSPQAELRMQNMMGLQTYNSIRALDWLASLPAVDSKRIGVTGASGGGTQTFTLCALDPRPAVAVPAVMVSTAMQGGCTCENACYLRVGTGNVELAALFAPRPLGLPSADDWTKEIATKGLPQLKQLYAILGNADDVEAWPLLQFKHNYNYVSRSTMYSWMNRHLRLGLPEPIVEGDLDLFSREELSVWDEDHPRPPHGDDYERSLLRYLTRSSEQQLAALAPRDAASLARWREVIGGALDVMIGRRMPAAGDIDAEKVDDGQEAEAAIEKWLVRYRPGREEVPVLVLRPAAEAKAYVVCIEEQGKAALLDADGNPRADAKKLLAEGKAVVGLDLFGQGEFATNGQPMTTNRMDPAGEKRRQYAGYTYGYNHPLFSQRVHDILSVVAWLKAGPSQNSPIEMRGSAGAGHWAAAARAQAGGAVERAEIDTSGFRFAHINTLDDRDFLPGAVKYGDLPAMLALSAPHRLILRGENEVPPILKAAYAAAGNESAVTLDE